MKFGIGVWYYFKRHALSVLIMKTHRCVCVLRVAFNKDFVKELLNFLKGLLNFLLALLSPLLLL